MRDYVPQNSIDIQLRRVSARRLGASAPRRQPRPAPQPRRRHSQKRHAKLATLSGTRLCTPKLKVHTVAQSVGDALGRMRAQATRPPRAAAPMMASARVARNVASNFGDALMHPRTSGTSGCAECRLRAWAHPRPDDTADEDAAPMTAFACARRSVGHNFGNALMYSKTPETCGCAECLGTWLRASVPPS